MSPQSEPMFKWLSTACIVFGASGMLVPVYYTTCCYVLEDRSHSCSWVLWYIHKACHDRPYIWVQIYCSLFLSSLNFYQILQLYSLQPAVNFRYTIWHLIKVTVCEFTIKSISQWLMFTTERTWNIKQYLKLYFKNILAFGCKMQPDVSNSN